jgi:hypothetical protein
MVDSRRKKTVLLIVGFILILIIFLYWFFRPSAQMAKVQAMRRDLFAQSRGKLSQQELRDKFEALRNEQAKLTAVERKQLAEEARKRRKADLEHYFTLTKAEKNKLLDQRIDQMEAMRRQMEAAKGSGRGAPGSGNAAGFPPGAGGQDGSPGRNQEDRERRRKEMLDSTTPEERAQMDQFRKDMQARRAQRGLAPLPGGPGGARP